MINILLQPVMKRSIIESSRIICFGQLSKNERMHIYSMYLEIYGKYGTTVPIDEWVQSCNNPYYDIPMKRIQIYYLLSRMCGYNIFSDYIEIDGEFWSKILEGGISKKFILSKQSLLTRMLILLTASKKNRWVIEVDPSLVNVIKCIEKSGFQICTNNDKILKIMNGFLGKAGHSIEIKNSSVLIHRSTSHNSDYRSILFIK